MTYQAQQNQRLADIAAAAFGSRAGVLALLRLNPQYAEQPFVSPGDLLEIPTDLYTTTDAKPTIVERLRKLGLTPATTPASPNGIGSMIIEGNNPAFQIG